MSTAQANGATNSLFKCLCADWAQQELCPLWCLHWHGYTLLGQVCVNVSFNTDKTNNIYLYIWKIPLESRIFLPNSIVLKCSHTLWILDHIAWWMLKKKEKMKSDLFVKLKNLNFHTGLPVWKRLVRFVINMSELHITASAINKCLKGSRILKEVYHYMRLWNIQMSFVVYTTH